MRRPGETSHEIAVPDCPVGRRINIFSARQSDFRRTSGVCRNSSAADHVRRGKDLCRMADRRDRFFLCGERANDRDQAVVEPQIFRRTTPPAIISAS